MAYGKNAPSCDPLNHLNERSYLLEDLKVKRFYLSSPSRQNKLLELPQYVDVKTPILVRRDPVTKWWSNALIDLK